MNAPGAVVCPVCLRDDRIQRVSTIVSAGTHEHITSTPYEADPNYVAVQRTTTTTLLARRLAPPPQPFIPIRRRPSPHDYGFTFLSDFQRVWGVASFSIFTCCLVFSFWALSGFIVAAGQSPQELAWFSSSSPVELLVAWGTLLLCAVVPLCIAVAIFTAKVVEYNEARARITPQHRHQLYLARLAEWERQVAQDEAVREKWRQAVGHWANDLYYCRRDDVVFLPGSTGVAPEQFRDMLYR